MAFVGAGEGDEAIGSVHFPASACVFNTGVPQRGVRLEHDVAHLCVDQTYLPPLLSIPPPLVLLLHEHLEQSLDPS